MQRSRGACGRKAAAACANRRCRQASLCGSPRHGSTILPFPLAALRCPGAAAHIQPATKARVEQGPTLTRAPMLLANLTASSVGLRKHRSSLFLQ